MGEPVLVDVPPLDVVLVGLQRQDRWFRGRPLELREERKCTTPPVRTTQTLTSQADEHTALSVNTRPNVSVTPEAFCH